MARQTRIQVTVSPEMTMALEVLAERTGLSLAAQAMVILRQGLDRTIQGDAVQAKLKHRKAFRNNADWHSDTETAHMVETVYKAYGPATVEEEAHVGAERAQAGR